MNRMLSIHKILPPAVRSTQLSHFLYLKKQAQRQAMRGRRRVTKRGADGVVCKQWGICRHFTSETAKAKATDFEKTKAPKVRL